MTGFSEARPLPREFGFSHSFLQQILTERPLCAKPSSGDWGQSSGQNFLPRGGWESGEGGGVGWGVEIARRARDKRGENEAVSESPGDSAAGNMCKALCMGGAWGMRTARPPSSACCLLLPKFSRHLLSDSGDSSMGIWDFPELVTQSLRTV